MLRFLFAIDIFAPLLAFVNFLDWARIYVA